MENTSSSSYHSDRLQSNNDESQLNDAASEPSASTTQPTAVNTTSDTSYTDAFASTSEGSSASDAVTNAAPSSSTAQQTPSALPQIQPAPATTLWDNFTANFRNVIQRDPASSAQNPQSSSSIDPAGPASQSGTQASPSAANIHSHPSTAASNFASHSAESARMQAMSRQSSDSAPDASGAPVYFRLPFSGPDGNPALLAFHPQPLSQRDVQPGAPPSTAAPTTSSQATNSQPSSQSQQGATQSHTYPTGLPGTAPNTTQDQARPRSHPHPDGHVPVSPIFVPFGASPLPFSFLYDQHTDLAWPIAQLTPGSPPGGPSPEAPESQQPRLVAGPPFRILLDIHFAAPPEPEQPHPEKAAKYVKQLERADAELRARMARLGMGSIGGFADTAASEDQDALIGCGVCLDNYEAEDRPEWIDGPKSQDEAVVAVPCPGHHTLHARCLREWLQKLPPSQWTCPFCRATLSPDSSHRPAQTSSSTSASTTSSRTSPKAELSVSAPVRSTLRDDVRARERQRGWRCDAPACLPRYPVSSRSEDGHLDLPETTDRMTIDLVKLTPCRHEVHLDCLCTSMRVENDLRSADDFDAIMGLSDDAADGESSQHAAGIAKSFLKDGDERDTLGKWVTCPACRKECWAELPLRRKPQRPVADSSAQQTSLAAPQADRNTCAVSDEFASPLEMPEVDSGNKARQLAGPVHGDQTWEQGSRDAAFASGDHEEEAVVDAMLLSS